MEQTFLLHTHRPYMIHIIGTFTPSDYRRITPVQMDKGKDNVLEVRFNHSSMKVFEVSAMAQKPIIKKN